MTKRHMIGTTFFLFVLIGIIHLFAIQYSLYWKFIWLDMPMHFLGGMFSGFVGLCFYYYMGLFVSPRRVAKEAYIATLVSVLIIGIAWEIYEYITGQTFVAIGNYKLDVVKDMFFDIIGAFSASAYFVRGGNKNLDGEKKYEQD